jgi:hypothetical protein
MVQVHRGPRSQLKPVRMRRSSGNPTHPPSLFNIKDEVYTDKKEKKIFLIYKEIQMGAVQSHI